jgi:dephospho-CoA kinase
MAEMHSQERSSLPAEPSRGAERRVPGREGVVSMGLTGAIGAGKSTALAIFHELGAQTISADQLVHELYAQPSVSAKIAARFGPGVTNSEGQVDRARLAASVRGQPGALRWLEELVHPLVAAEIDRRIAGAPAGTVVVCEVPLLFESGLERLFDLVITIEAGEEVRRRRSIHGFDADMFSELEALQVSGEERVAGSDLGFSNDGDVDRLTDFVRGALGTAQKLLEDRR